jgi:DHA1 family bicyclomycin/chloramphenicol resistance-like MFS transporter
VFSISWRFMTAPDKKLIYSLAILVSMSGFTIDVSLAAFPAISRAFDIPSGNTHLIVSAYIAGYALAQIPFGYLSEHIGRIKTLYLGLAMFTLGGLIATFSTNLEVLLVGRIIQGLGGAAGPVLARAIARDISSGAELGRLMALFISAQAISTIAAPIVGSLLISVFPWPSVFAVSLLLGLLCLLLIRLYVRETLQMRDNAGKDFIAHARIFFSHRTAVIAASLLSLIFFGYMSFVSSFSTIAADQFQQPASVIGWLFAICIVFYLAGSRVARRSSLAGNELRLLDTGGFALLLSLASFALAYLHVLPLLLGLALGMFSFLLAMGLMSGALGALVMRDLPHIGGTAAGIMGTMQMLAAALGSFASAALYRGNASSTVLIIVTASAVFLLIYLTSRGKLPRTCNQ